LTQTHHYRAVTPCPPNIISKIPYRDFGGENVDSSNDSLPTLTVRLMFQGDRVIMERETCSAGLGRGICWVRLAINALLVLASRH